MSRHYIRLDNRFVFKRGGKYYVTKVSKPSQWKKMTMKQKEGQMGKDVTSKIKLLLKKHGSKSNMNFKTKLTNRRIKTKRKRIGVKKGGS